MRRAGQQVAVFAFHRTAGEDRAAAGGIEQPRAGIERGAAGPGRIALGTQQFVVVQGVAGFQHFHGGRDGVAVQGFRRVDGGAAFAGNHVAGGTVADADAPRHARRGV